MNYSISVVIPSHKRHQELIAAVKSAINQTLPPTEIIVSNDGCDQEKRELTRQIPDPRIKYVESPWEKNPSLARNRGIQVARGNWIALLDDDDAWLLNKLKLQVATLAESGCPAAMVVGTERFQTETNELKLRPSVNFESGCAVADFLFADGGGASTSTILAPTSAFKRFPFDEGLSYYEDWDWMLRAGRDLKLLVVSETLCFRQNPSVRDLGVTPGYEKTKRWYEKHRPLMTLDARRWFLDNLLIRRAKEEATITALPWFCRETIANNGKVGKLGEFAVYCLLPRRARRLARRIIQRLVS